jgi:hypothetical protein
VLLISNVLSCFSVLVCCRSLVQKVAQRGEMKQRRSQAPVSAFDRTLCVRTQLRSNAVTTFERRSNQPAFPALP